MQIKEIMSTDLAGLDAKLNIVDAAKRMAKGDIGALIIVDGKNVIGMATDRDLVTRVLAEGKDPEQTTIRDVMTGNPVTCRPDESVEEAGQRMKERKVRRLIVQDEQGTPVGMVSIGDLAARAGREGLTGEAMREIVEAD
ncbi:MAG: CBS domain-containing protein [Candidatus Eisenbacteria bacterium]|nr:CBS domain-containing protein [Candidatus Eisenbacteria bacterium]